jgi:hypothetical protein
MNARVLMFSQQGATRLDYQADMQLVHKAQLSCATTAQQRLHVSRTHHQYTAARYFAVASLLTSGERHLIHARQ